MAKRLMNEGFRVWGSARSLVRLSDLALNPRFVGLEIDLADEAGALAAFGRAQASADGFDIVVNNAGFGVFGSFAATPGEVWADQLRAMGTTTTLLVHRQLGLLRQRGRGVMVNVSSLAVEFPLPYMAGYNVAKAGLSALSESLLLETADTAIAVIDFRPGDYRTDFNRAMQIPAAVAAPGSDEAARLRAAWRGLERHRKVAPEPWRAADDLWKAIASGRRGIVRSGGWFQARMAPFLIRLVPASWARIIRRRYFGLRS